MDEEQKPIEEQDPIIDTFNTFAELYNTNVLIAVNSAFIHFRVEAFVKMVPEPWGAQKCMNYIQLSGMYKGIRSICMVEKPSE